MMVTNENSHNPFCPSGVGLLEPTEVASMLMISLKTVHKLYARASSLAYR